MADSRSKRTGAQGKRPDALWPVLLWDTGWKLLAVRRALQLGKRKWVPALLGANTVGVLPIVFLWLNRKKPGA